MIGCPGPAALPEPPIQSRGKPPCGRGVWVRGTHPPTHVPRVMPLVGRVYASVKWLRTNIVSISRSFEILPPRVAGTSDDL